VVLLVSDGQADSVALGRVVDANMMLGVVVFTVSEQYLPQSVLDDQVTASTGVYLFLSWPDLLLGLNAQQTGSLFSNRLWIHRGLWIDGPRTRGWNGWVI
jgi:hypothetical protein